MRASKLDSKMPDYLTNIKPWCEMSFFGGLKNLFFHPNIFFECVKEEGLKPAFFAFLLFAVLSGLIEAVISVLSDGIYPGSLLLSLLFEGQVFGAIAVVVLLKLLFILGGSFILAGIFHLSLKLVKGQGKYQDTYKIFAYSLIPLLLIGLIPWIGLLGLVYSLVLLVIGLPKYHLIPSLRVSLTIIVTWLALSVISFVIGVLLIESLGVSSIGLFILLSPLL
ncbi:MAG TPA: YIP1 family protein [Candidatus Nanoarchaeia archaeon]|nr:YIP1 family protein [Candidatus Nanoarchaeia archaeon]